MSQLNTAKNDVSPDQIYFDLSVTNFQSTTTQPPVFYFNESRTIPFIYNPEDYFLSILRFTIETGSLPVAIPSIQPDQPDIHKTIYSVTLEWEDPVTFVKYTSNEVFVNFIPQDKSAFAANPTPPNQTTNKLQDNSRGYYNYYNYTLFPAIITLAMEQAFNQLDAALPGGVSLPTIYAPFLNWDTSSDSAVLYGDVAGYAFNYVPPFTPPAPPPPHNPIKIYWNAPLFGLFSTFPAAYLGYASPSGKNFLFEPFNIGSVDLDTIVPANTDDGTPTAPQYRAVKVYQDSSTTASFSPITALVFTSNTLPIQANQVSTPVVYINGQIQLGGNNSDFANIITDLVSDTGQYKPNVVYNPTAEYRLITLYGNRPISNIDIQVFWRAKNGSLIPYRINSGEAVTMKIAFLKKSSLKKGAETYKGTQ
jgi:hypothetical protein